MTKQKYKQNTKKDVTIFDTTSLEEMKSLALKLSAIASKGSIFLLDGDLGSGKTTFSRYFIESLHGGKIDVPSPTFTLLQQYKTNKATIWHYDLYRLKYSEELLELDILTAFNSGICLIEWPELAKPYLAESYIHLNFTYDHGTDKRQIKMLLYGKAKSHFQEFVGK